MRSKAPLALMEQLVMILVFALAAALCIQAFALADQLSRRNENRDRAVLAAESAAETLKACRGDYEEAAALSGGVWDGKTLALSAEPAGQVVIRPGNSEDPLLGTAEVLVYSAEEALLFSLPVAWQEVDGNA